MKSSNRDLVGYGQIPPNSNWPKKSKLAINFIINVEEGSEYSPLLGDKKSEVGLSEVPGGRHLENERTNVLILFAITQTFDCQSL